MSKVTPLFPEPKPGPLVPPPHLWAKCSKCKKLIAPDGGRVYGEPPNRYTWDKENSPDVLRFDVCDCPREKPAKSPGQSFFDAWLDSVQDLSTALERAKLRHEITELLSPDLKPLANLIGVLVDPAGVAVDMAQKYWEKQSSEKRAAAAVTAKKKRKRPAPAKKTKKKGKRR